MAKIDSVTVYLPEKAVEFDSVDSLEDLKVIAQAFSDNHSETSNAVSMDVEWTGDAEGLGELFE